MASGAAAHADCQLAKSDPVHFLAQRVNDPRLPLSPEARQKLQAAISELEARRSRRAETCPSSHAVADSVRDFEQAADELAGIERDLTPPTAKAWEYGKTRVKSLTSKLIALQDRVLQELVDPDAAPPNGAPADAIRERARALRQSVKDEMSAVLDDLNAAEASPEADEARAAVGRAAERLRKSSSARPAVPVDPDRLPHRTREGGSRPPRQSDADFAPSSDDSNERHAAVWLPGLSTVRAIASQATSWLQPDSVVAAPIPDELAPNEDVQITPAIQALAASLSNDPVEISDWVHNHIAFVPTYGSIQGSQTTLEARRGNGADIASLLIALLRAAGIAARYVTGTVEIPAEAVMNLVGGAPSPQVAQRLLGQGGIPNVGVLEGGAITRIRMEHVWVEAWIDYVPSRGASHQVGDTWVPIDPSFKRLTIAPPSNLLRDVPFDFSALSDQLLASGEFDPTLNRVAKVDQELIFPALEAWETQARDYMAAHGIPDSPEGILGGPTIVQQTSEVFAGSLPYTVIARGEGQATLPAALRHYVTLNGFESISFFGGGVRGALSYSHRLSLPALNTHRLGLRFDPATPADAATLESARSSGAATIPVYLIDVVPVLTLDGNPVATGAPVRMGSFHSVDVVLEGPDDSTTIAYDNLIAGDEIVFGITGNGVSEASVKARFDAFPPDNAAEYLQQIQLHYWMQTDRWNDLTARALGVQWLRLPSVGVFSSALTVSYLFGAPYRGFYQSRTMDVKQSLIGAAGPDAQNVRRFVQRSGYQGSFMEAEAFDQFEGAEVKKGISAVQLLDDAISVGIPVYQVTSANAAAVLPLLSLDARVKSDVNNAIATGKTVVVPGQNLDHGAWRGVGYIVQDPSTGAGAYLISGGLAGGGLIDCLPDLVPILVVILAIIIAIILLYLLFLALAALAAALAGPELAYVLALLVALLVSSAPSQSTA
jgi:transglutaminase-like putative cysteine protease